MYVISHKSLRKLDSFVDSGQNNSPFYVKNMKSKLPMIRNGHVICATKHRALCNKWLACDLLLNLKSVQQGSLLMLYSLSVYLILDTTYKEMNLTITLYTTTLLVLYQNNFISKGWSYAIKQDDKEIIRKHSDSYNRSSCCYSECDICVKYS